MDPRRVVADGYDRIAERYLGWSEGDPVRLAWLERLAALLPRGGAVLDIGCGAGIPVARRLSQIAHVTGIDISPRQVELARSSVPEATFLCGDVLAADLADGSFDAVCAFFAIAHLPREDHAELIARIVRWLKPGGVFVASFGAEDAPGAVEQGWLGAPMFFSQFGAQDNLALIRAAGLDLIEARIEAHDEDGACVRFLWVSARKDGAAPAGD